MFAKQNQVRTNKFLDGIISANLGRDSVTCVPMSGIFDNSLWDNCEAQARVRQGWARDGP